MYMQWSPGDKFFARVGKKNNKSKDFKWCILSTSIRYVHVNVFSYTEKID